MCNFSLKDAFLHYFDLRGRLQVQIFTCMYGTFHIWNHVRDHWFDPREGLWCVFTVKKTPLCAIFWLTWTCPHTNFSHERTCLYTTCAILTMFGLDRHVSTQCVDYKTCSCACSHTKKDRCLLTFWVTKSFLCVTLNIWHHFGHQIFHRQVETMYNCII